MIANTTVLSRMDYWLEPLELTTKNELLNFHSLPFVSLSAASYPRAFHAGQQQLLGTNGPARRSGRLQVLPGKEKTRNGINNVCTFLVESWNELAAEANVENFAGLKTFAREKDCYLWVIEFPTRAQTQWTWLHFKRC